jgi:hypothetical protein
MVSHSMLVLFVSFLAGLINLDAKTGRFLAIHRFWAAG